LNSFLILSCQISLQQKGLQLAVVNLIDVFVETHSNGPMQLRHHAAIHVMAIQLSFVVELICIAFIQVENFHIFQNSF
jgi:hypothetical protein